MRVYTRSQIGDVYTVISVLYSRKNKINKNVRINDSTVLLSSARILLDTNNFIEPNNGALRELLIIQINLSAKLLHTRN